MNLVPFILHLISISTFLKEINDLDFYLSWIPSTLTFVAGALESVPSDQKRLLKLEDDPSVFIWRLIGFEILHNPYVTRRLITLEQIFTALAILVITCSHLDCIAIKLYFLKVIIKIFRLIFKHYLMSLVSFHPLGKLLLLLLFLLDAFLSIVSTIFKSCFLIFELLQFDFIVFHLLQFIGILLLKSYYDLWYTFMFEMRRETEKANPVVLIVNGVPIGEALLFLSTHQ